MLASTEAFDTLKGIGLNLYERKIFVALLAKGVATAAEVSEIATVPRSRSYDILESLAEKGFVMVQPSKPIKYVALKPAEALEKTKQNMIRRHEEMLERIDKMAGSKILQELEGIYSRGLNFIQPTEMTGTLKGRHIINRQLNSIFKNAKKNINIVTTEQGLKDLHLNHYRILKKLTRNGIKLKIIAPLKDKKIADAFSDIAEMKHTDSPLGRICSIDSDHLVMALTNDDVHETQDMAFWTNSKYAVESIAQPIFNRVWKSGSDI